MRESSAVGGGRQVPGRTGRLQAVDNRPVYLGKALAQPPPNRLAMVAGLDAVVADQTTVPHVGLFEEADLQIHPRLQRLKAWVDLQIRFLQQADMRNGCLIGNYTAQASDHSDAIRRRLVEGLAEIPQAIGDCPQA